MRRGTSKLAAACLFLLFAALALGARCIEGTTVYVDDDGYTHIVGTIVNETDISATTVTLSGKLFDANDRVYAETTDFLCPIAVQPHSENVFDLRFPQKDLPPPARYEVRPIAGTTIATPLPGPHLVLVDMAAYRVEGTLAVAGSVRNDGAIAFSEIRYCTAAYDASGNVIKIQTSPLQGPLTPGLTMRVPVVWYALPPSATHLRVWLSVGPGYQWAATDRLPILNQNPPN